MRFHRWGNDVFDDTIQSLVFLGMKLVNITHDPAIRNITLHSARSLWAGGDDILGSTARDIDFTGKPLEFLAIRTCLRSTVGTKYWHGFSLPTPFDAVFKPHKAVRQDTTPSIHKRK